MDGYRTLGRLGLVAALIGVELYLARNLGTSGSVIGYTQTRSYSVTPQRRAVVRSLAVRLGATVTAGQLVAELDTTELDREIEAATADRARAIAAIEAEIANTRRTSAVAATQIASSSERANADVATAIATARTAAAELAAVELELKEQKELVKARLADANNLNALELRRAALAKQVDTAENVIAVLRGNATNAARRTAALPEAALAATLAPLEAALRAVEVRLDQLARERAALRLVAPADGVIEALPLRVGDLAGPDLPVATLVASDAMRVVACVPEVRAGTVTVDSEAEVTAIADRTSATGRVESVTGEIAPLPARCQSPNARKPALGRLAVVALDAPLPGLPGQSQLVRFHARRAPTRAPAAPPAPVSSTAPVRMRVPGALLARSRFEPSGLVWVPALARYVIVSDDTGHPERDDRAPWLLTMTADGNVDADPLVVDGVAELNDVESIALDADGALWLLASQSLSKKGKRSAARQQLVRVVIDGKKTRADGVVELAALLDAATPAERRALGIDDTRALDIEGLAAHGGALYIGLKAPVDGSGRAQIWKVAEPRRLLARDLTGARVASWATVALTVDADGKAVPGGIADMMFIDDRTLAIAATASGLDPRSQDGALYAVRATPGTPTATRVRTFPGLKPEGLAATPGGDGIAIVFDRGAEAALWTEIPRDQITGHAK